MSKSRKSLLSILVFLLLIVSCNMYDAWALRALKPPAGVNTIKSFADSMPPARHLAVITLEGKNYIIWIGEYPNTLSPTSDPPCYVFDDMGNLIDWSSNCSRVDRLSKFYSLALKSSGIGVQEAIKTSNKSSEK